MRSSEILVKGMVCDRCIAVIKNGLASLGFAVKNISLGKISLQQEVETRESEHINRFLMEKGFVPFTDRHQKVLQQIKYIISDYFSGEQQPDTGIKFSKLLSEKLLMSYDAISELFSRNEGITLEKYIIQKRLEKVKEFLVYTDLSLTQISYKTGYSSVHHLSRQFKEVVGLNPSYFREIKKAKAVVTAEVEKI